MATEEPITATTSTKPQATGVNPGAKLLALILVVGLVSGIGGGLLALKLAQHSGSVVNSSLTVKESSAIIDVAKKLSPSVVSITSETTVQNFFGQTGTSSGAGTGIIVSADGLILTNKHVVPDGNSTFSVITNEGKEYPAKVVARDPRNDIALVKIDTSGLKAASLGDSSAVQVGQQVVAIGNALGQYQNSVTSGIISGRGRPVTASDSDGNSAEQLQNLLQTDAAINPGNSGGPLVDLGGSVIGINTAVSSQGQNLGFALPINEAKQAIASYLKDGKIIRPYLGVRYIDITKDVAAANNLSVSSGALVYGNAANPAVVAGSPAAQIGLQSGDIITKIGGQPITASNTLTVLVGERKVGDRVEITYLRDGKERTAQVTLEASQ